MSAVDIQGAADLMKVHPKTVLNLIQTGALRAARISRAYVMLEHNVMNYIERQIVEQTADRMGVLLCDAGVERAVGCFYPAHLKAHRRPSAVRWSHRPVDRLVLATWWLHSPKRKKANPVELA